MGVKASGIFLLVMAALSAACYYCIGYLIPRPAFLPFILVAGAAFSLYGVFVRKGFSTKHFTGLLLCCLGFRLVFLLAVPELSDDYARFIWDGMLSNQGVNVYVYTPSEIASLTGRVLPPLAEQLKSAMNSVNYYSVYPPVLQLFFYASVKLGGASLMLDLAWFRIFSILAEAGTVYIILKLLQHFQLPKARLFLYALNPLVIIEFSGNLHGEVFMFLCLSAALWYLVEEKLLWSAITFGLAISTKLMPLILLPALIVYLGLRKGAVFCLLSFLVVGACFLPFANPAILENIGSSVSLYYDRFEFNASIYYLLLWIGYDVTGANIIFVLGKVMSLCSLLAICWFNFRNRNIGQQGLMQQLLFSIVIFYLFSLVVHPWYITVLVFLGLFTSYRFVYVWSGLVLLTYSAYMQFPYREILWLTAIQYIVVTAFLFLEYKKLRSRRLMV